MAGPWERYGQGQPQVAPPIGPRMIVAPQPKQVDPLEQGRYGLSVEADQRADRSQRVSESNSRFDNVAKLRTEFNSRKEVQDYTTILPQVADAMKIATNPNATGADDLSLIYTFGKVMDPGSVVREGELALASGTGSFAQNIEGAIERVRSGEKMPPEVRMNLVKAMQRRGVELARNYNRQRDSYRGMAERNQINPDDVLGIHPGGDFQQTEANFLRAPIRNRDGSMGAMPAGAPQAGQGGAFEFRPDVGGPEGAPNAPVAPTPGPDGWVRPEFNPNLSEEAAGALRLKAQQAIRSGASYDDVAKMLYEGGLSFEEKTLRAATQSGNAVVTSGVEGFGGLAKGLLNPIDRAAEGLQNATNYVLGTDFSGASDANAERDAYFAANPYDKGAETIGNVVGAAGATWRMGPMLGGAVGNVLAGDSDTGTEIATDAVIGAGAGKLADWTLRGAANALAPNVNPAAARLAREGVPLTPGQLGSRRSVARRIEDRATSLPGGGGAAIEKARDQSVIGFNRANANRALKSVGKSVPGNVEPGNATVKFVEETLSNEYDALLSQAQVTLDMGWAKRVAAVRTKANLPAEQAAQFDEIVQREITATFGRNPNGMAQANGRAFKKFDEKLSGVAAELKRKQGDPYARDLGDALERVAQQTYGQLRKQNPKIGKRLAQVDQGWAQYARIRSAAAQTMDGVYTPGQFRTAVRQGDRSLQKGAVAKGDALMQDMARDASEVLPSTVGNSGTADRQMVLDPRAYALGAVANGIYQPGPMNALAQFATQPRGALAQGSANALRQLPAGTIGGVGAGIALSEPPVRLPK